MSEKIHLVRDSEMRSIVAGAVLNIFSSVTDDLIADGLDLSTVADLKNAVQNRIEHEAGIPVERELAPSVPIQVDGTQGDADVAEPTGVSEDIDDSSVELSWESVELDKKSIFKELKGLR